MRASYDSQLAAICEFSRRENAKRDLTGVLFHDATQFVQVLEGPLSRIEQVYDAISRDLRHRELLFIEFTPVGARLLAAGRSPWSARTRKPAEFLQSAMSEYAAAA